MKSEFLTISLLACKRALYVTITHKQQHFTRDQDSSVGIATHYGLDVSVIRFRWGRYFPHPSRPAPRSHPFSCKMSTGSFPGVNRPGRGIDHPPPI